MDHQFSFPAFVMAFLVVTLLALITRKKSRPSHQKLPPGPWRLPIIGNMHQLVRSKVHISLTGLANKYGPIMLLQLGEVPHVVISSPEFAKQVLKTHDLIFATRPFRLAGDILAYNMQAIAFAPYGESWRQLRKICVMELLSAKRVQSFRSIREEEVSIFIKSIGSNAGSPVNLSALLSPLAYAITARTAFSQSPNQKDSFRPLINKIMDSIVGSSIADYFPSFRIIFVLSGMMARLKALHQETDTLFQNIVDEHLARRRTAKTGSKSEANNDLVDVLLNVHESGDFDFPLTMESIKAVLLDIFLAGNETAATVIEWTMSELLRHPRVMKKAQKEVRHVYGKKGYVDETSLDELGYLHIVVKETMRLHPGPTLAPREARETIEINGYVIPEKTKVLVNVWAIGRDPRYWTDPDKFYPERFLDNPVDYKGTDFQFIPFGAGRRICPGILYGMVNVELTLANWLYHFDWKLPNEMRPEDLDMEEIVGLAIRRRNALYSIPVPYTPGQRA